MDEEQQIANLTRSVERGGVIRDFCNHPAFAMYRKEIEDMIAIKEKAWLNSSMSDDEAKAERLRAQGLSAALGILKKYLLQAQQAHRILEEVSPNLEQPEA